MISKKIFLSFILILLVGCSTDNKDDYKYSIAESKNTISTRFIPLEGYEQIKYKKNSYEYFVSNLKLKQTGEKVYLYDGTLKGNQDNHIAIIDYSIGDKDLQQCADAIMRIRAEYFYTNKMYTKLEFHLTNDFLLKYSDYIKGKRLKVNGNDTKVEQVANSANNRTIFNKYLEDVFMYAGTLSMQTESKAININDIKPGDFYLDDEHAVLVVNVIENNKTKDKAYLVAQSYMPAQSIHILKNPNSDTPWYHTKDIKYPVVTPEWKFAKGTLKRYK